jgi:hypothetical protein
MNAHMCEVRKRQKAEAKKTVAEINAKIEADRLRKEAREAQEKPKREMPELTPEQRKAFLRIAYTIPAFMILVGLVWFLRPVGPNTFIGVVVIGSGIYVWSWLGKP